MKRSMIFVTGAMLVYGAMFTPVSGGNKQTDKGGDKKADGTTLDSPYYPLKVGTTWEYLSAGKRITVKVAAHETLDGVHCARLETDVGGGKVTEHLTVKPDGIYRMRSNNQEIKPPLLVLKLSPNQQPLPKGESWSVDSVVQNFAIKGSFTVGEEKLQVGKTQYDAITVKSSDLVMATQAVSMENWYAKDVGMVKQHFKLPTADLDVVLELEKFTAGK